MSRPSLRDRPATKDDLDALTEIMISASRDDPNYAYRFPYRDLYPDDFKTRCQMKCVEYLTTSTVRVFEMASRDNPKKAVAFSVWERYGPLGSESSSPPFWGSALDRSLPVGPQPVRQDARPTRVQTFRDECAIAKKKFFDSKYNNGYMFLKILLCHAEYRRRGAGQTLAGWGIQMARCEGLDTVLFSSPMGLPLYQKLGFQELGKFMVQVKDEKEFLEIPAMVLRREIPGYA